VGQQEQCLLLKKNSETLTLRAFKTPLVVDGFKVTEVLIRSIYWYSKVDKKHLLTYVFYLSQWTSTVNLNNININIK